MRGAFTRTLVELAAGDDRIVLLTGDLGYQVLEPFAERFPERFFNCGVAEQNMVGLATGLAESGFVPFVYSIATFASLRGYEFVRNGPIAHRLPVRIVGVGGGFEYGAAGPTHHGLEDLGVMRLQPGLRVLAPADAEQARTMLLATWKDPGPIYYRIGKDDRARVSGLEGRFHPGRAEIVREGADLVFLTSGAIASAVVAASDDLRSYGVFSTAAIVSTLNPPPTEDLTLHLERFDTAITVEAHYVSGGLGSLAAEVIAERGLRCRLIRCGVRQAADGFSGSPAYYLHRHGLSREAIAETAKRALAEQNQPMP